LRRPKLSTRKFSTWKKKKTAALCLHRSEGKERITTSTYIMQIYTAALCTDD
jgi:hypothetical protein